MCPQSLAPGSPALGELHLLTATKARLPQVHNVIIITIFIHIIIFFFLILTLPAILVLILVFILVLFQIVNLIFRIIQVVLVLVLHPCPFIQDFVKNLVTDGLGVELNNKVNEMNLILANHISDKVIDDVIDNLSR